MVSNRKPKNTILPYLHKTGWHAEHRTSLHVPHHTGILLYPWQEQQVQPSTCQHLHVTPPRNPKAINGLGKRNERNLLRPWPRTPWYEIIRSYTHHTSPRITHSYPKFTHLTSFTYFSLYDHVWFLVLVESMPGSLQHLPSYSTGHSDIHLGPTTNYHEDDVHPSTSQPVVAPNRTAFTASTPSEDEHYYPRQSNATQEVPGRTGIVPTANNSVSKKAREDFLLTLPTNVQTKLN